MLEGIIKQTSPDRWRNKSFRQDIKL